MRLPVAETVVLATITSNTAREGNLIERQVQFTPVRAIKGSVPATSFTLYVRIGHDPATPDTAALRLKMTLSGSSYIIRP